MGCFGFTKGWNVKIKAFFDYEKKRLKFLYLKLVPVLEFSMAMKVIIKKKYIKTIRKNLEWCTPYQSHSICDSFS